MKRYLIQVIDKMRRIILPVELMEKIGLGPGDIVTLKQKKPLVVLQSELKTLKKGYFNVKIDEEGRLELPVDLMKEMGWKIGYRVKIYYAGDRMVNLTAFALGRGFMVCA